MKFKLVIDKTREEEIVATVRKPSELTARIEELVIWLVTRRGTRLLNRKLQ